jgi:hypothetical protein
LLDTFYYDQQLDYPEFQYSQQVINDPATLHDADQPIEATPTEEEVPTEPTKQEADVPAEPTKQEEEPTKHEEEESHAQPVDTVKKIQPTQDHEPPKEAPKPTMSNLPIKQAAATSSSMSSTKAAAAAAGTTKPALASVVTPPRQQEKPAMGQQHSEPNIPPGIPQQSKPSLAPGSDLGTLGRIGVFGEDSWAVHNTPVPFMQLAALCFLSIWFVLCVKRS